MDREFVTVIVRRPLLRLSVSDTESISRRIRHCCGRCREGEGGFMSALKKAAIVLLGTAASGIYLAVPAGADPGYDPCRSIYMPICRMLPLMPDLDHDIDLTQDPDGLTDGQGGQIAGQPGASQGGGPGQSAGQSGGPSQSGGSGQPGSGQSGGNPPSAGQSGGSGQSGANPPSAGQPGPGQSGGSDQSGG